ncbi:MAG: 1-deoxy-D-xylulose-5-phosphate synthase [Clostridia bacterium]|nr:1-deoxy-D-xylulose-5-phosphate synthase [Clostridia bacterium]
MDRTDWLAQIKNPADLRKLTFPQVQELCAQIRQVLTDTVSHTGGHLSSNLGVVELTVALHRELNLPQDTLLFDVGHQCYTHKLLTGRYDRFATLRRYGGLSGFPNPQESPYDAFVAGHSSTSLSVACGIAAAKRLHGEKSYTVALIGDGALTGGLAYEGLSNLGREKGRLIVVLNDNRMSIDRNVGFVARYLTKLRSRAKYIRAKDRFASVIAHTPLIGRWLYRKIFRLKTGIKNALYRRSSMFEEMGLYYLGPVDGHDLKTLTKAIRAAKTIDRPVLLHVVTIKGKGFEYAAEHPDTYHGVSAFDKEVGVVAADKPTFSSVFGKTMEQLAEQDPSVCAVTAAMSSGTGLTGFAERFPDRFFDVGIAEEHAVTFASAMASRELRPVVAVYSTFLQRGYDQIVNDVSIMGNHVVLAVDRAGPVPADGETHQGLYDAAFLRTVPGMRIDAPANFTELRQMLQADLYDQTGPFAIRYPKGGEPERLRDYQPRREACTWLPRDGAKVLLVTYGTLFARVAAAADRLPYPAAVLKLNRIWPLDEQAVRQAARFRHVFFFEEAARAGGIGEAFGSAMMQDGVGACFTLSAVEGPIPCCTVQQAAALTGLDEEGILHTVQTVVKEEESCASP